MDCQRQIEAAVDILCAHEDFIEDTETAVADTLGNILHFCHARDIEFDVALARARRFLRIELAEAKHAD